MHTILLDKVFFFKQLVPHLCFFTFLVFHVNNYNLWVLDYDKAAMFDSF